MELLLGCGSNRTKKIIPFGKQDWDQLITLDNNSRHKPDYLWDLNNVDLPFSSNYFDEIHAYEVLEHLGTQGDARFFFEQWSEFWRILKPGGVFCGTVPLPSSPWAWGDPSHTRVIPKESFIFLSQPNYNEVGISPISDFRGIYKADFDIIFLNETDDLLQFALQTVKPARIKND